MPAFLRTTLLGLCILLASCSGPESVQDARGGIDIFHGHLDAGNIDAIWQSASAGLTGSASKEEFSGLLVAIQEKLGNVVKSVQVGWKRNISTSGNFVTVNMETTFERGTGKEEFVFCYVDEQLHLGGYHINWKAGVPSTGEKEAVASQSGEGENNESSDIPGTAET
jgi:hypothetical protein